ncbi:MAG: hypothetical protein QGM50_02345 [Anaerolineae bacterium]|nr:hypothetical protein [Anaerolineae bacterium]
MARADIVTWLPLDRWAEIIGIHPLHFNGLVSTSLIPNNVCGGPFFQFSWQHSDRIGTEDIAMAIQAAEQEISREVGYNLMPDWTAEERLNYTLPGTPGVFSLSGINPRGMFNSIELRRGHIISGGIKTKTVVSTGASFVRSDIDSDGFQETCTVTVATTVTDKNEIHLFYPAQNGANEWEIRPIKVAFSGANVVITFNIWQIRAANQMEKFNPEPLDAEDNASYESTVDVYRVHNDPSVQIKFLWENFPNLSCCGTCVACQFGTQTGCFHLREARLGLAVPAPAAWDSDDEEFDKKEWAVCRGPDQIQAWYYSGFEDKSLTRPRAEMSKFWEYAVAYYAASKLDRDVCGCSNVNQFIANWRMDMMVVEQEGISINITPELLSNKLGTTRGAIYAYRRIHQNGVRIIK